MDNISLLCYNYSWSDWVLSVRFVFGELILTELNHFFYTFGLTSIVTLQVIFAEDVRHRRRDFHRRFCLEERMIAFFITAAIIRIIIVIVMKKSSFSTNRTRRIFSLFRWKWFCTIWTTWNKIRCKLMFTNAALVLLVTEFIFAIFIKFFGVASWATMWYNFIHEILISFLWFSGRYSGLW